MGGGLATAIMDYAAAVPEARHIVLCDLENDFQTSDTFPFAVTHAMPRSFPGAVAAIRTAVSDHDPDVIHAHSSFAGLYARLGLGRELLQRVIYTPHCYAFFRRDVSPVTRALFWLAEAALTLRAPAIAACSPDEARAARRLARSRTTYVPNVASLPQQLARPAPDAAPEPRRPPLIVSLGRMCPQKDPLLFLDAALAARAHGLDYEWLWIGGGDDKTEKLFRRNRVRFTGWLPRDAALAQLAQADIYVHTAAWEGAPISVLEAGALRLPVLGRHTAALESLGLRPLWGQPEDLMALLREGLTGAAIGQARARMAELLRAHTVQAQRAALLLAYSGVREQGRRRSARGRR